MGKNILFPRWLWIVVIFLISGILGHDPWKQDETYSFGIIYHFLTTHTWLIPYNAGVAFMEKPPLYYWSAVIFCKIFGTILPLHDAARLASVFYILIASFFVWKSADIMFAEFPDAKKISQAAILLFLGTLGVARHAHDMFTDVALLAGAAITLYGTVLLALKNHCWQKSGFLLGLGAGIAFLSKGLFMPGIFGISTIALICFLRELRTANTGKSLVFAFITAAPFLFIWPVLLYLDSTPLFMEWFWENNVGRFLGFSVSHLGADNKPFYILYSVLWFAFPVFPLAVVALISQRQKWREPGYLLPLAVSATGMAFLTVSASARALYLLPLTPAFAVLAVRGLLKLPERFLVYWNDAVRFLGVIAVMEIWLIWLTLQNHNFLHLPFVSEVFLVDYIPAGFQWLAVIVSAFATVLFITSFGTDKRVPLNAVFIWFASIATVWITVSTLLLPWIDETKSYRPVLNQMEEYIAHSPYSGYCMNEYKLGESIAPMFEYFGKTHTVNAVKDFASADCPVVFTVTGKHDPEDNQKGWKVVWKGSRPLDAKDEELRLYVKER